MTTSTAVYKESEEQNGFESAILAVQDKNPQQFDRLHNEFFNLVVATAYRVLNDTHDAEDVAQEVFASLWKKAHLYDSKRGKPSTWLTTIARNRAIDRLRSKQRRSKLQHDAACETDPDMLRDRDDVVSSVRRKEESRVVRSAVLELNPEQREAIELTYFQGLSQSEAAKALGTPIGTVKARVRRALMRLRATVPNLTA